MIRSKICYLNKLTICIDGESMKFINGISTELRYDEMTALDRAIDQYSKQADKYFKEKLKIDNLPINVRNKRIEELQKAKAFLEHQRMNAESYAAIQVGLDKYQEQGRSAMKGSRSEVVEKQRALMAEKHHPTKILASMMKSAANPPPSSIHTAHHIIPGKGKVYKTKEGNLARVHMHRFGIRINDPDNGVWLPRYKKHTPHWSMPESKGHLEYHTKNYERWAERKVRSHRTEFAIRSQLKTIGNLLQENKLPNEAR